jgi:NAD(P)-dependent dehydrogenase (short-subunit alcohol dehydrogenase family)
MDTRDILVTGGQSGIGEAAALALAKAGHRVTVVGRSESKGAATVEKSGGAISFMQADLSTVQGCIAFCAAFVASHSALDSLVLGAGLVQFDPEDRTEDDLPIMVAVNFLHRYHLAYRLLPLLSKSKDPRIVFLCAGVPLSTQVRLGDFPKYKPYSFFKYGSSLQIANYHVAQSLAEKHKISVGVVSAGIVLTDATRGFPWWMLLMVRLLSPFIAVTCETSARNLVFAAAEKPSWAGTGALYWASPGKTHEAGQLQLSASTTEKVEDAARKLCFA